MLLIKIHLNINNFSKIILLIVLIFVINFIPRFLDSRLVFGLLNIYFYNFLCHIHSFAYIAINIKGLI